MGELWRAIPGLEGKYEVSDKGRVRCLVTAARGRRPLENPRIVKLTSLPRGYTKFSVRTERGTRSILVHHAVLTAFVGPAPSGREGGHRDGDPSNNTLSNLYWATHAENESDRQRHGRVPRGSGHHAAKLTEQDVIELRAMNAAGVDQPTLAARFGITQPAVSRILSRDTWRHIGEKR